MVVAEFSQRARRYDVVAESRFVLVEMPIIPHLKSEWESSLSKRANVSRTPHRWLSSFHRRAALSSSSVNFPVTRRQFSIEIRFRGPDSLDYYCCRLGDVILRNDLGRTGLKSRSHAIDSAYIEMKSLAVRSDRSFALGFVERATLSGTPARSWFLIDRCGAQSLSYLTPILRFGIYQLRAYLALSLSSITAEISCRAVRWNPLRRIMTAKLLIPNDRCPKATTVSPTLRNIYNNIRRDILAQ